MFERFTDRARKVMALANQEAHRLSHDYIGTEHILLGLIKEGSGVGANVLRNLSVDLAGIRAEVGKLVPSGSPSEVIGKLPHSPNATNVIKHAIEEARQLNQNYIGTEHLLLGLLHEQDGVAAQVLVNLGLSLEAVRMETLVLLGNGLEPTAPAGASADLIQRAIEPLSIATQRAFAEGKESLATELREITKRLCEILGKASGDSDKPQATNDSG